MTIPARPDRPTLQKRIHMIRILLPALLLAGMTLHTHADQLYINPRTGNDANTGSRSQPLKTLAEAARRINASDKREASTIFLSEGIYPLTETVRFGNDKYTAENRLLIRAETLPDDPGWNPQRMPIIVSVIPTTITPADGEEARGLEI